MRRTLLAIGIAVLFRRRVGCINSHTLVLRLNCNMRPRFGKANWCGSH